MIAAVDDPMTHQADAPRGMACAAHPLKLLLECLQKLALALGQGTSAVTPVNGPTPEPFSGIAEQHQLVAATAGVNDQRWHGF